MDLKCIGPHKSDDLNSKQNNLYVYKYLFINIREI